MGGESHRERNWTKLNHGYRSEYTSFLRVAKEMVWRVDTSRLIRDRSKRGAPIVHDIRALIALTLFKIYFGESYRWMESYLKGEPSILGLLELRDAPSYETIRRCMYRIDMDYLYELNERVTLAHREKGVISR
jgi:hypothetical protein